MKEQQPSSVWVYVIEKYHTPLTTHSCLGVELTVLSRELSQFNPAN